MTIAEIFFLSFMLKPYQLKTSKLSWRQLFSKLEIPNITFNIYWKYMVKDINHINGYGVKVSSFHSQFFQVSYMSWVQLFSIFEIPNKLLKIYGNRYKSQKGSQGAQWLRGRVLDSRLRGRIFEPHRRHCVVSLSKTHLSLLITGSTQQNPSRYNWKIVDWDVKKTKVVLV